MAPRRRRWLVMVWTVGTVSTFSGYPAALAVTGAGSVRRPLVAVAVGLLLAGFAAAAAAGERSRRSPERAGRWFRIIAIAIAALFVGHAVSILVAPGLDPGTADVVEALPLMLCGGVILVGLAALMWPLGIETAERRAAVLDGAVGALGLALAWAILIRPLQSGGYSGWVSVVPITGTVIEFAAVVAVLVLAACARRRALIPITQVVLIQSAILVYVAADLMTDVVPDRTTGAWLSAIGFCVSAGLVMTACLRPAHEQETARQLRLRDAWSSILPLSPVPLAAGLLLFALVSGARPGPVAAAGIVALLLIVITSVLWMRLRARSELRKAVVSAATTTFDQATNQPWFQALIQNSRDIVVVVDRRHRIVYASPTLCGHLGADLTHLQGRPLSEVIPSLTATAVREGQRFPDRPAVPLEATVTDWQGADHDVRFHVAPLLGLGVDGYVLTGQDVTDDRTMRSLLGESRRRDRLTGLLNGEAFLAVLTEAQGWSDPRSLGVAVIDVCDLRALVDAHGRASGEALVLAVTRSLEQSAGPILAVGRLKEDSFAVLVRDPVPDVAVSMLATSLRAVGTVQLPGGLSAPVRLAVGYSTAFADAERAADLVEQADLAASHSLSSPQLPVVRFEHSMRSSLRHEWEQRAELERALTAGEFVPFYQPVVSLADGQVKAVEALARRRLPDGSVELPGQFIPVAQRVGRVAAIDATIRAQAFEDLGRLSGRWPELGMCLNVTPEDFDRYSAVNLVAEIHVARIEPARVTFEFTEATVARSVELAAEVLAGIRESGARVALDDFGTGFSSLASLRHLDVDVLKIDQSFIADVTGSERSRSLLRSVVQLGRDLDAVTVAEGVSTVEQMDLLRGMGCHRAQGHVHAEALAFEELVEWLSQRTGGKSAHIRRH